MTPATSLPAQNIAHYRADIDGLRAVAVLAVIGYHAFPSLVKGGFIGVDIFFVISGFLITGIIANGLEKNKFSFLEFYARRILRIFPALFVVLLAVFIFGWFTLFPDEFRELGKHITAGAVFIANFRYWKESGYFDASAEAKPLLHLWSLGVEEQFYIIFPLLLYLAWKKRFRLLTAVSLLLAISFAANIALYQKYPVADFYSPLTRFWELLFGSVLAVTRQRRQQLWSEKQNRASTGASFLMRNNGVFIRTLVSGLGFILIAAAICTTRNGDLFPGFKALLPVAGSCCILLAGRESHINRVLLSNKLMVGIGLISYPLYLWHWPLISYVHIIGVDNDMLRGGAVVAAFVFSWLTYKLVERPLRFGPGSRRQKVTILAILMAFIALAGFVVKKYDGLPKRAAIVEYQALADKLKLLKTTNESGLKYFAGIPIMDWTFAHFNDVGSDVTILIFGDSHAMYSYPGIARLNAELGINTAIIGGAGVKRPLLGIEDAVPEQELDKYKEFTAAVLEFVRNKQEIKKIFIITRGVGYMSESYPEGDPRKDAHLSSRAYQDSMQSTVNFLHAAGKEIFIVSEVPEQKQKTRQYIPRPLRNYFSAPLLPKDTALGEQKRYLEILDTMDNATVLRAIDVFCPKDVCLNASEDNRPFYIDDNHLSGAGSDFLAKELLQPYLRK